jgi:histone H3/H4
LCAEHAKALGVKAEDLQEVFKLVDNIEEKIHNGLK